MKRLLLPLVALAFAVPGAAQETPPPGPFVDEAVRIVAAFLQLDREQVDAWILLGQDREAAARPLRQAADLVNAELQDLLASPDPDAAAVGVLVIERRNLGDQLAEVQRLYVEGFEALLDEDQSDRLGFIRRAARARPVIPAFERLGLLAPPNPGTPPQP